MSSHISLRKGPYHYSPESPVLTRTALKQTFTLFIASAYNAGGLIGSEHNGIVILNDTNMSVVADRICEESSGYYGPSTAQTQQLRKLIDMSDVEFVSYVVNHNRYRPQSIDNAEPKPPKPKVEWGKYYTGYDDGKKEEFHRQARSVFKKVARELGLKPKSGEFDIRTNMGGPAVNGETTLHTQTMYVQIGGLGGEILARTCEGMKDYTGGRNNYLPASLMKTPTLLATELMRILR